MTRAPNRPTPAGKLELRLFRGQVWPRRREIVRSRSVVVSLVAATACAIVLPALPSSELPISDVAGVGFSFASISIGACVSAVVLSIGLPGADRLKRWSLRPDSMRKASAFEDLVFVLVWAVVAQLLLVATCTLALLFGGSLAIAPSAMTASHRLALASGLAAFFYALSTLYIVVRTLMQVAVVIAHEERGG